MTITTSYSNKELFFRLCGSFSRRLVGVSALAGVIGLLLLPMQYLLALNETQNQYTHSYSAGNSALFLVFFILMPVLLMFTQYTYLYQRNGTDLFHSLPVRRELLLLSNFVSGFLALLVPMILNVLIAAACFPVLGIPLSDSVLLLQDALVCIVCMLTSMVIASIGAAAGGARFESLVVAGTLLVFSPQLIGLVALLGNPLFGFSMPSDFVRYAAIFSPLVAPFTVNGEFGNSFATVLLIQLALAVLLGVALVYIYRTRKSEVAGQFPSDSLLPKVARLYWASIGGYVFAQLFTSVLVGTASQTTPGSVFQIIILSVIGGALGFVILEAITAKGFQTIRDRWQLLVVAAVAPILLALFPFINGGLGYETRVPDPSSFSSVVLMNSHHIDRYNIPVLDATNPSYNFQRNANTNIALSSEECRELVNNLHRSIVDEYQQNKTKEGWQSANFRLHLQYQKNMAPDIYRDYWVTDNMLGLQKLSLAIATSEEYLTKTHPVFRVTGKDIAQVSTQSKILGKETPLTLTPEDTEKLLLALRTDMVEETADDAMNRPILGFINLYQDAAVRSFLQSFTNNHTGTPPQGQTYLFGRAYVAITDGYKNTLSLLDTLGAADPFAIDYQNIQSVNVALSGWSVASRNQIQGPDWETLEQNQSTLMDKKVFPMDILPYGAVNITDPAKIRLFADAITNRATGSLVQADPQSPLAKELSNFSSTVFTIALGFVQEDGLVRQFTINPNALPKEILLDLEPSYAASFTTYNEYGVDNTDSYEDVLQLLSEGITY